MKLTFFGHSAFQIETAGATILVDPFITDNPLATDVISEGDLNPDAILLTHAHGDHWGDTPAIAKRSGAVVVANFEITQYITKYHGHENVQPMNTGGGWSFDWGRVTATRLHFLTALTEGIQGDLSSSLRVNASMLPAIRAPSRRWNR